MSATCKNVKVVLSWTDPLMTARLGSARLGSACFITLCPFYMRHTSHSRCIVCPLSMHIHLNSLGWLPGWPYCRGSMLRKSPFCLIFILGIMPRRVGGGGKCALNVKNAIDCISKESLRFKTRCLLMESNIMWHGADMNWRYSFVKMREKQTILEVK